jgi:hypothetical protein
MSKVVPFWFSGDESFADWLEPAKGVAPEISGYVPHVRGPFVVTSTDKQTNNWLKEGFVFRDLFIEKYLDAEKAVRFSSNVKVHVFEVAGKVISNGRKLTFDTPRNGEITIRPIVREDLAIMRKLSGENLRSLNDAVRSFWSQGKD